MNEHPEDRPERLLKGVIRYDGTDFWGWQVQPRGITVQGVLEDALSRIANRSISVIGASRTDSGVHAFGQVFSFSWPMELGYERLPRALSGIIKPIVRIESIEPAPPGFHARRSSTGKRYAYALALSRHPDPMISRYAWSIPWPIDVAHLETLAQRCVGRHDFAGFASSGSPKVNTERTIQSITLHRGGFVQPIDGTDIWRLEFIGNGFLYHMVRNLMGTLVDVARGHFPEEWIAERLASPGPYHGYTAPGHGLALLEVFYE